MKKSSISLCIAFLAFSTALDFVSGCQAKPQARPAPTPYIASKGVSYDDVKNERLILSKKMNSVSQNSDVNANLTLVYGLLEDAKLQGIGISVVKDFFSGSERRTEKYTFRASILPNDFYIFDPVYLADKKTFVFKYGKSEGSLDQYRIMSYKEGEAEAHVIINYGENLNLRNRNTQISPDGKYIAYILGGDQLGPDYSYFSNPLELWVCSLETKQKQFVARGDTLNNFYHWRDNDTLLFGKANFDKKGKLLSVGIHTYSASGKRIDPLFFVTDSYFFSKDDFQQDLSRALLLNGIAKSWKMASPANYRKSSLNYDTKNNSLFYATDTTSKRVINAANTGKKRTSEATFTAFQCKIGENGQAVCVAIGKADVLTSEYDLEVRRIFSKGETSYLLVKSFSPARSPVTKEPNVSFPTRIYSLFKIDKNLTKNVWTQSSVAGLSISRENEPPVLLPY